VPARTLKPCAQPGCPTLVKGGTTHCDEHRKARHRNVDARRGTPAERGYTREWATQRRLYLMAHPICRSCGAAASEVDHIEPHRGDQRLFWDSANWQPLCRTCHSRKTALEDGGFGNARASEAIRA
jgi:5-methylcytosine-specific restriction protein A